MKIASLLPSSTEIVCALGLAENLVGITHECDFPASIMGKPHLTASRISHETMSSKEIDHAVRSQLDGHGSIYDLNTDLLQELKPDVILTQELCEVCAVSYQTVLKAAKMYVAEAQVVSLEPNTIEDIFDNIKTIGEICGVSEKANELIESFHKRINYIRTRINQSQIQNPKSKIMMLEWLEPPFAPGHWVPEQVEIAGGICLLGQAGTKSMTVNYQQIYEANPDILVLIPCGYYTSDIIRQLDQTAFPANWANLAAIQKGEVWALDATSYFSRPGPRVVDGTEILAKIIHPEIFGMPSQEEAVRIAPEKLQFAKANNQ